MNSILEAPPVGKQFYSVSDDVDLIIDGDRIPGFYDHRERQWYSWRKRKGITKPVREDYIDGWEEIE